MTLAAFRDIFLSRKETEWDATRVEIEASASQGNYEKMYVLAKELENDAKYMLKNENRQYVMFMRGFHHIYSGKGAQEAIEMFDKAIKITLPH